jgi:hypothetical protein
LASIHSISLFDEDPIDNSTHRHLDILDDSKRFEFTLNGDDLLGLCYREPADAKPGDPNESPGNRPRPENWLLEYD